MNARLMGRPARAAAALGALVAAAAVTLVATMGTANAEGAGRCVDNVNVRSQPDISSEIVAVCERGQAVQIGETRNGFVELTDLKGWAAQEFVSVNGHVAAAPTTPRTTSAAPTSENGDDQGNGRASGSTHHRNAVLSDPSGDNAQGTDAMGEDRAADDSTAAAPTAGADSPADGTDVSPTDASATDASATDADPNAADPNAAPTTQASAPASPVGALGHLLG